MTRIFWYALLLAIVAAAVGGVSWILAYNTVGGTLGDPPPEMGKQTTAILWKGMPRSADHSPAWRFAFSPTQVPGAPNVVIYVSPLGKLLRVEPADLAARVKAMHGHGYN